MAHTPEDIVSIGRQFKEVQANYARLKSSLSECVRDMYGRGLTQMDIAEVLGISQPTVSRILKGGSV